MAVGTGDELEVRPSGGGAGGELLMVEGIVFAIAAAAVLAGGVGVVASRNPVHAALSLVGTLFGVAVLFVAQDAHFLAAVQVIVYAGAIVVLFLFVIMLLGVDRAEDLRTEPLTGQRPAALVAGGLIGLGLVVIVATATITGLPGAEVAGEEAATNVVRIGRRVFTDYLFAFEVTSVLLVIAVVGAVVLAQHSQREAIDEGEPVDETGLDLRQAAEPQPEPEPEAEQEQRTEPADESQTEPAS